MEQNQMGRKKESCQNCKNSMRQPPYREMNSMRQPPHWEMNPMRQPPHWEMNPMRQPPHREMNSNGYPGRYPVPDEPYRGMYPQPGMEMPYYPGGGNGWPMPYYQAYPYPIYMQEDGDEKDMERLVSMFPESARKIQPLIEDVCDRMEYDGSLMFDEYPDKLQVEHMVGTIYRKMQETEQKMADAEPEESVFATQCSNCGGEPDPVADLIRVMLFEEMYRRRCRRRKCRRWW